MNTTRNINLSPFCRCPEIAHTTPILPNPAEEEQHLVAFPFRDSPNCQLAISCTFLISSLAGAFPTLPCRTSQASRIPSKIHHHFLQHPLDKMPRDSYSGPFMPQPGLSSKFVALLVVCVEIYDLRIASPFPFSVKKSSAPGISAGGTLGFCPWPFTWLPNWTPLLHLPSICWPATPGSETPALSSRTRAGRRYGG